MIYDKIIIFLVLYVIIFVLLFIDLRKKRIFTNYPTASFIVPTYNDSEYLKRTIDSIYNSYPNDKLEIFVVNDNSTDNTSEILKKLKLKYNINIIENEKNMGKVESINNAFRFTKNELLFLVDSDIILDNKTIKKLLSHFEYNKKVGAVSCRYDVINKGFFPSMVNIEFAMLGISHSAYNMTSSLSLWGGCMVFRRNAFEEIGMLKKNMITEDMDACLNLQEKGWKVEQCWSSLKTNVPSNLSGWMEQKIRWASGGSQCFFKHPKIFLKNPLCLLYIFMYSSMFVTLILGLVDKRTFNLGISFLFWVGYSALSIPYVLINVKKSKDLYKIFHVFLFTSVYYPMFYITSFYGLVLGSYKYFKLKEVDRGW